MKPTNGLWNMIGAVAVLGALVSFASAGCGRPPDETAGLTDTSALTGEYAPQPGATAEAMPLPSRGQHVHLTTHRVRHRHAGPR